MNVYANGSTIHGSREKAETHDLYICRPDKRIACVMVSYTEGQFDE